MVSKKPFIPIGENTAVKTIFASHYIIFCLIFLSIAMSASVCSQTNPNFNVNLLLDFSAVEQSIELFEDQPVSTQMLAELKGNRIAAFTAMYIADRRSASDRLQSDLDSLKYHERIIDDMYHLEEARKNAPAIRALLDEMKKQNFNRRVVATVEQIFPEEANITVTIPVYVVSLGHDNVDAFVRRIVWHGDEPQFVGENQGELTIVVNLAHAVGYGQDVQHRFVTLLGVVAHEVFHAAFGAYKETSPSWKYFYQSHQRPFDALLDITQNEGIAYYLSLDQAGGGYLPRDWYARTREVFTAFNANASDLLSEHVDQRHAQELLRKANLSGYWESYGAMAGMFMAREIDLRLGRKALIESIAKDPLDFFQKYATLSQEDSNLPKFTESIISAISQK